MYKFSNKEHTAVTNRTTGASGIHPGVWQYEAYQSWKDAGGITEAFDTRTPAEIIAESERAIRDSIELALDTHIDTVAGGRNYGTSTMSPTASLMSYAGYPNIYQIEALAFANWRASVWPVVHQIYADVQNGLRGIPTIGEVLSEIPKIVWPS